MEIKAKRFKAIITDPRLGKSEFKGRLIVISKVLLILNKKF